MTASRLIPLGLLAVCLAAVVESTHLPEPLEWQPPQGTRKDFYKYHGMDKATAEAQLVVVQDTKRISALRRGKVIAPGVELNEFMDDMLLTLEQGEYLRRSLRTVRRYKRKITNFENFPYLKWPSTTIEYAFDGTHSADEQLVIRNAMNMWESKTCFRFVEVADVTTSTAHYILFTGEASGCWSYIGKVEIHPQQLNLDPAGCLYTLGVAAHEIGHAIGFDHEHVRPDRDTYVQINTASVDPANVVNFQIQPATVVDSHSIPFDFSSIMQYTSRAFSTDGKETVLTKDPLFQTSLGQRVALSFYDAKLANLVYCDAECTKKQDCLRGGYTDPNNCSKCICPDGFGGDHCSLVARSDASCGTSGGSVQAGPGETCITSPGYGTPAGYADQTSCNWRVQAAAGCTIDVRFQDDFSVFCREAATDPSCYHWVELKYRGNMADSGPRFCCNQRPIDTFTSEGSEFVVSFRSNFTVNDPAATAGFKLCYKLTNPLCDPNNGSTPSSGSATTTAYPKKPWSQTGAHKGYPEMGWPEMGGHHGHQGHHGWRPRGGYHGLPPMGGHHGWPAMPEGEMPEGEMEGAMPEGEAEEGVTGPDCYDPTYSSSRLCYVKKTLMKMWMALSAQHGGATDASQIHADCYNPTWQRTPFCQLKRMYMMMMKKWNETQAGGGDPTGGGTPTDGGTNPIENKDGMGMDGSADMQGPDCHDPMWSSTKLCHIKKMMLKTYLFMSAHAMGEAEGESEPEGEGKGGEGETEPESEAGMGSPMLRPDCMDPMWQSTPFCRLRTMYMMMMKRWMTSHGA